MAERALWSILVTTDAVEEEEAIHAEMLALEAIRAAGLPAYGYRVRGDLREVIASGLRLHRVSNYYETGRMP
jgi:hypothetical protein